MLSERRIISIFESTLPMGRCGEVFAADAERFDLPDGRGLVTTDEFSGEDLLCESNGYSLGWNIAAGSISDILACGGVPRFYVHAVTVAYAWDARFVHWFARGMAAVLRAYGVRCIGGDTGRSDRWRCTGTVIASEPRLSRVGARVGDALYVSGPLGAGNAEAALMMYPGKGSAGESRPARFALRAAESRLAARFASSCIDTSDGLLRALATVASLNNCGFRLDSVPYLRRARRVATELGLAPELLIMGECGEYELLFTVGPGNERALLNTARDRGCRLYRIGEMTGRGMVMEKGERRIDFGSLSLSARDFDTPRHFVDYLCRQLERTGG